MSTPFRDTRAISTLQLALNLETTGQAIRGFLTNCDDTVRAEIAINALISLIVKDIELYKEQRRLFALRNL